MSLPASAAPPTAPAAAPAPVKQKHRACDECRQRKLACSKDAGGCNRCVREAILCLYSEQKPMGRPRKRQLVDKPEEDHANILLGFEIPLFMDTHGFYNQDYSSVVEPYLIQADVPPLGLPNSIDAETGPVVYHFGDRDMVGVELFDFKDVGVVVNDNDTPPLVPESHLSTRSNPSLADSENSPWESATETEPDPCSCLASIYLSLAALQKFPKKISPALKIVREAAAVAAKSLWCPQCGSILLETCTPPIESFQNTMLLGTIIPVIASGYARLLTMIDAETDAATAAGNPMFFTLKDYGGMHGKPLENVSGQDKSTYNNPIEMPPAQWRTSVRALLRVDIFGHEKNDFKHKGLNDLVAEMEYRQNMRHDMIDIEIAAGNLDHGIFAYGHKQCPGEQTRTCLEIVKLAKLAIDSLVIA